MAQTTPLAMTPQERRKHRAENAPKVYARRESGQDYDKICTDLGLTRQLARKYYTWMLGRLEEKAEDVAIMLTRQQQARYLRLLHKWLPMVFDENVPHKQQLEASREAREVLDSINRLNRLGTYGEAAVGDDFKDLRLLLQSTTTTYNITVRTPDEAQEALETVQGRVITSARPDADDAPSPE